MSALATVESSSDAAPVAQPPDLRDLVRKYARYTLFRRPIPGESLPALSFPLVTAGVVVAADVYASGPGPGDRRAPIVESSPEPDAGFRLQRGDPTGRQASLLHGWRRRLANSVRPQLTWVDVERWRVYCCWRRLPPVQKQAIYETALHTSIEPERDANGDEIIPMAPHIKSVAKRMGMSDQAVRRHVSAGCEAMVQAIYERLTTPARLLPPDDADPDETDHF